MKTLSSQTVSMVHNSVGLNRLHETNRKNNTTNNRGSSTPPNKLINISIYVYIKYKLNKHIIIREIE